MEMSQSYIHVQEIAPKVEKCSGCGVILDVADGRYVRWDTKTDTNKSYCEYCNTHMFRGN